MRMWQLALLLASLTLPAFAAGDPVNQKNGIVDVPMSRCNTTFIRRSDRHHSMGTTQIRENDLRVRNEGKGLC